VNFLAHCVLGALASESRNEGLIAGGILGDLWKGVIPAHWPPEIRAGVRLHRRVDAVSNQHPGIRRSCERFPADLRRLAPVFVDIHADLALTGFWNTHVAEPQTDFIQRCNGVISNWREWGLELSPAAAHFLDFIIERDLLTAYGTWEGVGLCMEGVARRLRKPELPRLALSTCQDLSVSLCNDFNSYFPDLQSEARRFISAEFKRSPLHDEVREQ
jgi:acyl carrier protein phosphodiesterase